MVRFIQEGGFIGPWKSACDLVDSALAFVYTWGAVAHGSALCGCASELCERSQEQPFSEEATTCVGVRPRSHAMTHSDDVRLRSDRGVTRWDQDDRRGLTCSGTPVECCPSPVCSDTVHSFHPLYLQPCIPFLRDSEYMLSLFATLRDDNPSPTLVNGEQDF